MSKIEEYLIEQICNRGNFYINDIKKYLKNKNVYTKYEKIVLSCLKKIKENHISMFIPTHYFTNTGYIYPNWLDYIRDDNSGMIAYKDMWHRGGFHYPNNQNKKFYCKILKTYQGISAVSLFENGENFVLFISTNVLIELK